MGLAKALFIERTGVQIVKLNSTFSSKMQEELELGTLTHFDLSLADSLLPGCEDQAHFVTLCYLSICLRMGHLCVYHTDDQLIPDPAQIFIDPKWVKATLEGFFKLPSSLFDSGFLIKEGKRLYFAKNWDLEKQFLHDIHHISERSPTLPSPIPLDSLANLNVKQKEGVVAAIERSLTLISGGPGTGKTFVAGYILAALFMPLSEEERSRFQVALAAPTGKAAANLQTSIQKVLSLQSVDHSFESVTLHSLLSMTKNGPEKLTHDLVIVDESSMIDVGMMVRLVNSIKPGARLVMLGDPWQLPPVEAGSLFADLIKHKPDATVTLEQCERTEEPKLILLGNHIKEGDCQAALHLLIDEKENPISFHHLDSHLILPPYPRIDTKLEPDKILSVLSQFRLLSPVKKGPFGVDQINKRYHELANNRYDLQDPLIDPIMIATNDYHLKVYNGDTGVLIGDIAYFINRENGSLRSIPKLLLPHYELAYCISVHKSQGSEFDTVALILPEGSEFFGREMLYTAVTRTKKQLNLYSTPAILEATIKRRSQRLSGIR